MALFATCMAASWAMPDMMANHYMHTFTLEAHEHFLDC